MVPVRLFSDMPLSPPTQRSDFPEMTEEEMRQNRKLNLKAEDMVKLGVLGKGASGVVFLALHLPSLSLMALKVRSFLLALLHRFIYLSVLASSASLVSRSDMHSAHFFMA